MKDISLKNIKMDSGDEKRLIDFNKSKTPNVPSIFEKILFSLKKSSSGGDIESRDLSKLERYIKVGNGADRDGKGLIDNFKNLAINSLDSKNDNLKSDELKSDSLVINVDNINSDSVAINNGLIDKKEDSNLNIPNYLIVQKARPNDKAEQKIEILQKSLLSRLKIFESVEKERIVSEIKDAKSIGEILNIAKKYKLNLTNIEIKEEDFSKKKESSNKELSLKEITKVVFEKRDQLLQHKFQNLDIKPEYSKDTQEDGKKSDITLGMLLQHSSKAKDEIKKSKKDDIKQDLSLKKSDDKLDNKIADDSSKILDEKRRVDLDSEKRVTKIKSELVDKTDTKALSDNGGEKVDFTETKKVVGFEETVKPNDVIRQRVVDAKQMVLSFAKTLQEQVENYKPPFTRMQLSLDPEDLGKVDVTLVSRGKNLHVQVNSNPTAIGVMAIQGNELRNQLTSMGFTDVQMQFNMNQQQQQQQQNNKKKLYLENEYIDIDEIPENYESLEIVLPNYA